MHFEHVPQPFYRSLYFQVLVAIAIGVLLGHFAPESAIKLRPLGDGFIKLVKMMIGPIIFCTVVSGIAGMESLKVRRQDRCPGAAVLRSREHAGAGDWPRGRECSEARCRNEYRSVSTLDAVQGRWLSHAAEEQSVIRLSAAHHSRPPSSMHLPRARSCRSC